MYRIFKNFNEKIITKIKKINNLAFHAYGCRVIQKILEYSDFEKVAYYY